MPDLPMPNPIPAKKYRMAKEQVKLYPRGAVDKKSVDSLKAAGYGKIIGEPVKVLGQADMYGAEQGDRIKSLMRKK